MNGKKIMVVVLFSALLAPLPTSLGQELRGEKAHLNPDVVTFWHKLGIPQGVARFKLHKDSRVNRDGLKPGKERKPKLKRLADPANLEEGMPKMVQAAAKIKIDQDLAPQKIKALRYISSVGCSCYNKQAGNIVEEALIEGMKDCVVDVRIAAIQVVLDNAGSQCSCDGQCHTCCSRGVVKTLEEIAYKMDDNGCYVEPNEQVRCFAQQALNACPPLPPEPAAKPEKQPKKDPEPDPSDTGKKETKLREPDPSDTGEKSGVLENLNDDDAIEREELKLNGGSDKTDPPVPDDWPNGDVPNGLKKKATDATDNETTYQQSSRRTIQPVAFQNSFGTAWNDPAVNELEVRGIVNSVQLDRSNVLVELVRPFEFPLGSQIVIAADEQRVSFGTVIASQPGQTWIKVDDVGVVQQLSNSQRVCLGVLEQVGR